jgi:hypothetical protein
MAATPLQVQPISLPSGIPLIRVGRFITLGDFPAGNVGAPDGGGDATVSSSATLDSTELPLLVPRRPSPTDDGRLGDLRRSLEQRLGSASAAVAGQALAAGLLQINDWLDESHQAAQAIEDQGPSRSGDYWHAIMHRREPDYGNAKYWFRRVGAHPVFPGLAQRAAGIIAQGPVHDAGHWRRKLTDGGDWKPLAFVDLCESASGDETSPLAVAARRIQWEEMLLLLDHCWREATLKP